MCPNSPELADSTSNRTAPQTVRKVRLSTHYSCMLHMTHKLESFIYALFTLTGTNKARAGGRKLHHSLPPIFIPPSSPNNLPAPRP